MVAARVDPQLPAAPLGFALQGSEVMAVREMGLGDNPAATAGILQNANVEAPGGRGGRSMLAPLRVP